MTDTSIIVPSRLLPRQGIDWGRKPVGTVEIDWSHPLVKGLRLALIFNDSSPQGLHDLMTNQILPVENSIANPSFKVTKHGVCAYGGAGTSLDRFKVEGRTRAEIFGFPDDSVHDCSITTLARTDLLSGRNGIFAFPTPDANNGLMMHYEVLGSLRFTPNHFFDDYATVDYIAGDWGTYTGTYLRTAAASTSETRVYANGVEGTPNIGNSAWPTSLTSDTFHIGLGFDGRGLNGECAFIFAHNRVLSASEIASLHADPYQFLREVF